MRWRFAAYPLPGGDLDELTFPGYLAQRPPLETVTPQSMDSKCAALIYISGLNAGCLVFLPVYGAMQHLLMLNAARTNSSILWVPAGEELCIESAS